jgi:mannobiose 2-epimerase
VLCARVLWTFSSAYRIFGNPEYLAVASRAYKILTESFIDEKNGGLFWSITPGGRPADSSKQTYGQGFALYAFSEYYRACKNREALEYADGVFGVITQKLRREKGYIEAASADFTPFKGERGSAIGRPDRFSMNTHLHILEPVTSYMRIRPEAAEEALKELIGIFTDKILDDGRGHFNQYFNFNFDPVSETFSYGHDIEESWLICEAAEVLKEYGSDKKTAEEILCRCSEVSLKMARAAAAVAINNNGGILEEGTPDGVIINPTKVWWSQAEGVVGFFNAFRLSGEEGLLDCAVGVWNFIDKHIIDHVYGEWFSSSEEHARRGKKVHAWKCPYHNGRAAMEIYERTKNI